MNNRLHKTIFNQNTGLKYLLLVWLLCLSQITFANTYKTQDISGNLNTDLTGGIITSTQTAEDNGKNRFSTGTLKATDIENHSEYSGESFGIGISGTVAANDNPNSRLMNIAHENSLSQNGIGYGHDSGKEYSVTKSGINTANIIITNKEQQQALTGKSVEETIANIKTEVTTDNYAQYSGSLNNNFDADRVQSEIDLQREVTQEFSRNVQDLNRRQNQRKDDLKAQLERNEITQQYYNEQVAIINRQNLALNMIAGGLMSPSDSILGIATSTVAPAVSFRVGQHFKKEGKEGSFEHIATHAVIGALTSAANGGNALSGAVSAGGAEYIAQKTAETLFQKDAKDLTADEKQTVSSIAQLVGVVSGSLTGDSSANAYIGGTVATNAVENNQLRRPVRPQSFRNNLNSAMLQSHMQEVRKILPNFNGFATFRNVDSNGSGIVTQAEVDQVARFAEWLKTQPRGLSEKEYISRFESNGGGNDNIPANLSPLGAGRTGAFNQAKRDAYVQTSTQPTKIELNTYNSNGKTYTGKVYYFGQINGNDAYAVRIRDDIGGHYFGLNNPQNRGSHFNVEIRNSPNSDYIKTGKHYDYTNK